MKRSSFMNIALVTSILLILAIFAYFLSSSNNNETESSIDLISQTNNIGQEYLTNKQFNRAREYYSQQIVAEPENAENYYNRGQAFVGLGDYEAALNDFSEAIILDVQYAEAYTSRANIYLLLNNLENAQNDINEAISLKQDFAPAHLVMGKIYEAQKSNLLALHSYDTALSLDKNLVEAYVNRGNVFVLERNFEKALADYDTALELAPDIAEIYAKRSEIFLYTFDYENAETNAELALKYDNQNDLAYAVRGAIHLLENQSNAALLDFDRAIEINPKNTLAYAYRAYYFGLNKDADSSMSDFTNAINLQEDFALTYFLRGLLSSEASAAVQDFLLATEYSPTWDLAHYYLAYNYELLGETDLALDSYTTTIDINPNFMESYLARADIYRERKYFDEAIEDYTKVIALNPNIAIAYRGRSLAYAALGNFQDAHLDRTTILNLTRDHATIMVGEYDIEVTRIWADDKIEGIDPGRGLYLVFEMTIYNYSSDQLCLLKRNFKAHFGNTETEPSRMYQVAKEHNLNKQYPPTESRDQICVPDTRYWDTFVSFDVPSTLDAITLDFGVEDNRTTFEFWLLKDLETSQTLSNGAIEYSFILAEVDGEPRIEIGEPVILATDVESISDIEIISIDNCSGNGVISQSVEKSHTHTRDTRIDNISTEEYSVAFTPGIGTMEYLPITLEAGFEFWYSYVTGNITSEGESNAITETTTVSLEVAPQTIGEVEIVWMILSQEGKIDISINGITETLQFSVDDKLKAVTRSLPSKDCSNQAE